VCGGVESGHVRVAGQRMTNENRVVPPRRQFAERLVGDLDFLEFMPGLGDKARQRRHLRMRHAQIGVIFPEHLVLQIAFEHLFFRHNFVLPVRPACRK